MGRSGNFKVANRVSPLTESKNEQKGDIGHEVDGHYENTHGIHWVIVVFLIVGETAGGGLIALPNSMVDTGIWAGAGLIIISAIACCYTANQLGENWLMMQDRWPEYRHSCRKPYPEMAYRALGTWGRNFMNALLPVQQFCLSVVFLLIASNNISSLLFVLFSIKLNFCFIAFIVAGILLPLLMLGSPKDFWQVGLIAVISTTTAIVFLFIGTAFDQDECMKHADYPPVGFNKFFLTYGTIMFAYGGHSCFPTFHHDMKKPNDFYKSVIVGYIIMLLMYLPISVYGYLVYGGSLTGGSIIPSLQLHWVQTAVNILITVHVMVTEIIIMSPLSLTLEELFGIPNSFGIKRFTLRSVVLLAVLFMALSVPKFGPIVDFIGGTSVTITTMILPGIISLSLVASKRKRDHKVKKGAVAKADEDNELPSFLDVLKLNKPLILLLDFAVIAFGVIGGVAATVSAVNELISTEWELPCYISLVMGTLKDADGGLVHCCGAFRNITTVVVPNGEAFCAAPGL